MHAHAYWIIFTYSVYRLLDERLNYDAFDEAKYSLAKLRFEDVIKSRKKQGTL